MPTGNPSGCKDCNKANLCVMNLKALKVATFGAFWLYIDCSHSLVVQAVLLTLRAKHQNKSIIIMNDEIVIYKSEDGVIKIDVLFSNETVWLTIDQMSALFNKSRSTINEHILNVYAEGELPEEVSKRKIGISDFSTKPTNFYNLDVVISVGYRVKSKQGTQFRQWATQRLRDYIVKGFALEDCFECVSDEHLLNPHRLIDLIVGVQDIGVKSFGSLINITNRCNSLIQQIIPRTEKFFIRSYASWNNALR